MEGQTPEQRLSLELYKPIAPAKLILATEFAEFCKVVNHFSVGIEKKASRKINVVCINVFIKLKILERFVKITETKVQITYARNMDQHLLK